MFENTQACFLTSIIVRRSQLKPATLGLQLERNEKGLTGTQKGAIIQKLLEAEAFDIRDGEEPSKRVGIDCCEGPPVPIPNTEVKLTSADNTWRVTAREDR